MERAFKPMGYDCRGGSGTFTLRRRAATNLAVELVENVAVLVRELDRSFVPEIEKAAGPSPEWYRPES